MTLKFSTGEKEEKKRWIELSEANWGRVGKVELHPQAFDQSLLRFLEPGYPERDEIPLYRA
jgi:hypothetical protein